MEIKVYADGSKIKNKVFAGLTLRQIIGFGTVFLTMILMVVNLLLIHLNSNLFSLIAVLIVSPILLSCFFNIRGLPADRWFRLCFRFYLTQNKRTYQTERIKVYPHGSFTQEKKVKETDRLDGK